MKKKIYEWLCMLVAGGILVVGIVLPCILVLIKVPEARAMVIGAVSLMIIVPMFLNGVMLLSDHVDDMRVKLKRK